jgi:predicted SAM-dependent methyltransferase
VKLELGSGYAPTRGFFHIDLNPNAPQVDRVAPAWPLDWVADASVSEIRAVDVLEHISYRDTGAVLSDWARVLRPRGKLFVQVPEAAEIMRRFVAGDQRLVVGLPPELPQTVLAGATWRLLGGHADGSFVADGDDFRLNAHYALVSVESLTEAVVAVGLKVVSCKVNGHPNILMTARKS